MAIRKRKHISVRARRSSLAVRLPKGRLSTMFRRWRRLGRTKKLRLAGIALVAVALGMGVLYSQTMPTYINPTAYRPLLDTIAKGESNGNYNAYFGSAGNTSVRFTDMTIEQVLQWQTAHVQNGSPSSAVGKYQIVRPTLAGLVQQLHLDLQTRFDPPLQDQLAIALLERRGASSYIAKELSREAFAANLAKEWAALPRVTGGSSDSYYAHDGLNRSSIGIDEIFGALAAFEKAAAL